MPRPRIVAFTGSTRRPSKSRSLAEAIAEATRAHLQADIEFFDVADAGRGLGAAYLRTELPAEALRIVAAIEQADAVIAITPTYKGSYTGLFKHLIDFVDLDTMVNKPVVIGATGGGHRHALIVEHQLRPLFGFFSALIIPTSLYASDHEFQDGRLVDAGVLRRIELAAAQLALQLAAKSSGRVAPAARPEALGIPHGKAQSDWRRATDDRRASPLKSQNGQHP